MKNGDVDKILNKAAGQPYQVAPAVLERVADSIKASMRPVRPLPPNWLLTGAVVLVCAVVSLAGAARAGFLGFAKMDVPERVLIFLMLGILACIAGVKFVSEFIPGGKHRVSAGVLLGTVCAVLLGVFGLLFRDYRTEHFVSVGITCLVVGLLHAIPTGLVSWWVLRRGFAVNPVTAGLMAGMFAGLAGVTMLELHCPNFEAFHILVWHTAVVPVSAALGALVGWMLRGRGSAGVKADAIPRP
ncbi:MAG: NrsF family protein [Candidatus Acidiferrum sp.]